MHMSFAVDISLSRSGVVDIENAVSSAVFLTGETFVVKISIFNTDADQENSLAWGCVQLHCEENLSAAQKNEKALISHTSTAVTLAKQAIFSSNPVILFCDIHLEPGTTQSFETTKEIPINMPPTFKGHFVKYLWYVSVAVQKVDAPIKMIRLPVKVINVGIDVSTSNQEPIEHPFLRKDNKSPSFVDIVVNRIEEICSIRKQRLYEIKSGGTLFATIVLYRNMFKLGDDVIGRLEFPQEEVKCLQTLVRAEIVEMSLIGEKGTESNHACNSEHIITAFVRETHFKLQLPINSIPSFTTESVKVKWRLRFEFVTTVQEVLRQEGKGFFKLTDDLNIETMKWDFPIFVLTCNPFNAGLLNIQPSTISFNT